jgi:hypothetical protein
MDQKSIVVPIIPKGPSAPLWSGCDPLGGGGLCGCVLWCRQIEERHTQRDLTGSMIEGAVLIITLMVYRMRTRNPLMLVK